MLNWLRRPRRPAPDDGEIDAFYAEVMRGGWIAWLDTPPPAQRTVEIWRRGWPDPAVITPAHFPGAANIAGLYWREIRPMFDVTPREA